MKLKVGAGECKNNILPVVPLPMLIALDPFRSKRPTPPFLFEKKKKKKEKCSMIFLSARRISTLEEDKYVIRSIPLDSLMIPFLSELPTILRNLVFHRVV